MGQLLNRKDSERDWPLNTQSQTFSILDAGEFVMGAAESSASLEASKVDAKCDTNSGSRRN